MFPRLVKGVSTVLSGFKQIGSGTSSSLTRVQGRVATAVDNVSHDLRSVLHTTRSRNVVSGSVAPAVHSKHLVVPITPTFGQGVGKVIRSRSTDNGAIFVRPRIIIRTGGHVHRLRNSRHERVVGVLARFAGFVHPLVPSVLRSCRFLTRVSFVHTGTLFTRRVGKVGPIVRSGRRVS